MSKCRFLNDDGTCSYLSDEDYLDYCVQGPCSAEIDEDGTVPWAMLRGMAWPDSPKEVA